MQALLYANLAKQTLSDSARGSGNFTFPTLTQGDDALIRLRYLQQFDGATSEVERTTPALRATLSLVGRPARLRQFHLARRAGWRAGRKFLSCRLTRTR